MRLRLPFLSKKSPVPDFYDGLPDMVAADLRSIGPVHVCSCGSQVFNVAVTFEDYEIAWWFLDATCVNCNALVRVPCPADDPDKL